MVNFFNQARRSGLDRRTGDDRRRVISLDYFASNGRERRARNERRKKGEMRKGWVRVNRWSSVFVGSKSRNA